MTPHKNVMLGTAVLCSLHVASILASEPEHAPIPAVQVELIKRVMALERQLGEHKLQEQLKNLKTENNALKKALLDANLDFQGKPIGYRTRRMLHNTIR